MFIRRIVRYGVEKILLHVIADGGIAVFVERQGSGSMLEQEVQQANLHPGQPADLAKDFVGDQMKTAGFWPKRQGFADTTSLTPFANESF